MCSTCIDRHFRWILPEKSCPVWFMAMAAMGPTFLEWQHFSKLAHHVASMTLNTNKRGFKEKSPKKIEGIVRCWSKSSLVLSCCHALVNTPTLRCLPNWSLTSFWEERKAPVWYDMWHTLLIDFESDLTSLFLHQVEIWDIDHDFIPMPHAPPETRSATLAEGSL